MARAKDSKEKDNGFPIGHDKQATESTEPENVKPIVIKHAQPSILIKPTIGRMVLYKDGFSDQMCAAQISYVWNDEMINIGYLDSNGMPQSKTSVKLIQDKNIACDVGQCQWMDYQVEQAK